MSPNDPTVEELLKGSFLRFLWYVWVRVLDLPEPTRVQNDIAKYLAGGPRKRFIAAFRGVGKTYLTGAYIVWRLWKNPNLKILVVSANETFAGKVAGFMHQIINARDVVSDEDVPWAELRAKAGQKDSTLQFDVGPAGVSKDPSVFAVGINGQLPGARADLIVSDDVEVPTNSETEGQREKLESRTGEYAAVLKPGGEVVYLGTFQSMMSIYRKLQAKGYGMRLWPARYPLESKLEFYRDTLAPILLADLEASPGLMRTTSSTLGGSPTDPDRFHEEDLMEREAEWGRAGFQLQFMLDTSLADAARFPLKTRDLIVMDLDPKLAPIHLVWGSGPKQMLKDLDNLGFDGDRLYNPVYVSEEWRPYTGSMMEIDPSGSGTDETAYAVTSFLNGHVFLRKWGGFKDGHSENTMKAIAAIAVDAGVPLVRVEENFGDGMFTKLLQPHLRQAGFKGAVEGHKVHGAKEARIVGRIQPVLENHRLVVDTQLVRDDLDEVKRLGSSTFGKFSASEYSGLFQLTHMANARGAVRKDDRVDVLANALGYWLEHMALDSEKAEETETRKQDEDFARLVRATQIGRTGQFTTPNSTRNRGSSRRLGGRRR